MGPIYIETPYVSSHMGPIYIVITHTSKTILVEEQQ